MNFNIRINKFLDKILPDVSLTPSILHEAMRYSVLSPGKRLRAGLVYSTGRGFGACDNILDYPAAAVELIHAYSLIHDDLPILDNDDFRRGLPSCHKAFGEDTALLAGDALQTLAFEILTKTPLIKPSCCITMINRFADFIGSQGLIGGEMMDVKAEKYNENNDFKIDHAYLLQTYDLKTAMLFKASILLGALAGGCQDKKILKNLEEFAHNLGIAFQIQDDILEVEGDPNIIGKPIDSDQRNQKTTFISLLGLKETKQRQTFYYQKAFSILPPHLIELKEFCEPLMKRLF